MQYDPGPRTTHINHLENRLAYAERLVNFVDMKVPHATAAAAAAMNHESWCKLARLAGEERMPAEATINVVVGMLFMREKMMKQLGGKLPAGKLLSLLADAPDPDEALV